MRKKWINQSLSGEGEAGPDLGLRGELRRGNGGAGEGEDEGEEWGAKMIGEERGEREWRGEEDEERRLIKATAREYLQRLM